MKRIKEIFKDTSLYFFIAISSIFFINLLKIEYATDTYAVFNFTPSAIFYQFASSGRWITAVVGAILKVLKIKNEIMYMLSFVIAFVCIVLSQYKMYIIIKEDIKNNVFQKLVPILIIINIFSIELFLFIEKGIMTFAILMCVLAVDNLIKLLKFKNKKYLLYSVICMMMATCSYQGVVGLFVAIAMIYILKYSKTVKDFIKNNFIVALIYGIPAILDYCFVKIFYSSSRINGEIVFSETLKKININTQNMIKYTYNILPKYLLIIITLILIIISIYEIVKSKQSLKIVFIEIGKIAYIIFGVIIVTILPQVMQSTQSIWFVPRSTYTFASIFGILMLYGCISYNLSKTNRCIIVFLSIILLVIQFNKFNIIEIDRYKLNALDFEVSKEICAQIKEYEKNTGIEIKNIAIYKDEIPNYTYENIFATGDINVKAYSAEWSCVEILNYYSGKKMSSVQIDEELEKYFKHKNWNSFNLEQIKFDGDTLHLCCY